MLPEQSAPVPEESYPESSVSPACNFASCGHKCKSCTQLSLVQVPPRFPQVFNLAHEGSVPIEYPYPQVPQFSTRLGLCHGSVGHMTKTGTRLGPSLGSL